MHSITRIKTKQIPEEEKTMEETKKIVWSELLKEVGTVVVGSLVGTLAAHGIIFGGKKLAAAIEAKKAEKEAPTEE